MKLLFNVKEAALFTGWSSRHFRRIAIEAKQLPKVIEIKGTRGREMWTLKQVEFIRDNVPNTRKKKDTHDSEQGRTDSSDRSVDPHSTKGRDSSIGVHPDHPGDTEHNK